MKIGIQSSFMVRRTLNSGGDLCREANEKVSRRPLLHAKVADQIHRDFCSRAALYGGKEVLEADACVHISLVSILTRDCGL